MDADAIFSKVKAKYNFSFSLRDEQKKVLSLICNGKATIGCLPTGYGKSLTFWAPPLMKDEVDPDNSPHVALVISPLRSLMADQASTLSGLHVRSVVLLPKDEMSDADIQKVRSGSVSVIFTSPEAINGGPWLDMIRKYKQRLCLLVFDEIHCVTDWGADFRPDYLRCVELRSSFSKIPILGLSATVNNQVLEDLRKHFETKEMPLEVVGMVPDRPNIFLEVVHQNSYDPEDDVEWIVEGLRLQKEKYPKTVIFAQTVQTVGSIYSYIKCALGPDVYCDSGDKDIRNRIVSVFHGQSGKELQEFILETFGNANSRVRVLVATIAFGMGVEVKDIEQVVHWGRCKSVMCFWQEIGRGGRDGRHCAARWYPQSSAGQDKELFESLKRDTSLCVRKAILTTFLLPGMKRGVLEQIDKRQPCSSHCTDCHCDMCQCCSHCRLSCNCFVPPQVK